jgi:glycosyltransferase involved in cell wall biosynthesis
MKLFRFVHAYFQVFYKLVLHRYDICYLAITCHGIGFLKDAPFVLLCKSLGRKVIIHQHNKGMNRYVGYKLFCWLLKQVYEDTNVILLSWKLYPDVARIVKKEQVRICPNGIPALSDEEVNIKPHSIPRIFFLSNLVESKGVYVLLDACKMLMEKGVAFICHLVGAESKEISRNTLEEEIRRRGLVGMVQYYGPQYGKDKERFFQEADIFVQPTFEDCFPLTIIEAMQYSLPVVATSEGAIPDMVQDGVNGFVCKQQDVDSLVIALEQLITNPALRQQMGEAGYQRYKELYTLEAFEKRFVELLSV